MGVFAVGGAALGFLWVSNASISYRSQALLEMTYARDIEGNVTSNDGKRIEALNRLVLDLSSPEETERLQQELHRRGVEGGLYSNGEIGQGANVDFISTRSRRRSSGPPYLAVVAKSQIPEEAQWLATEAADIVMERINSNQGAQAQGDSQFWAAEADLTAAALRQTLAAQRAALAAESGLGGAATAQLIEEHSMLLGELRTVLADLQTEVVGVTGNDPTATVEILRFGRTLAELQGKVRTVGNLWEQRLRAPLDVLYTIEAQPEYKFLLVREELLQTRYASQIRRLTSLSESLVRRPQMEFVTKGDYPERIQVLGLKRRYVIAVGGGGGLFLAWLLANLGENILVARARRREAAAEQ